MDRRREFLLLVVLAVLSLLTNNGEATLTQKYCSNENTASNSPDQSIYQSNGHCITVCSKYAFAVVQGQNCWCSNYVPSDQQSTSSCNEQCPGYPYENCGSTSSGLYGYVAVGNAASGTAGSSETSDSAASTLSTSIIKGTTPTPVVTTIISSGNVVTITTTPTAVPMQTSKSGAGMSKGAVAGVVVAAFAGLAIVGFGLFFCLRRRRKDEHIVDSTGMITTPSRMDSQMSRNGLLGNPFRPNSIVHMQQGSSSDGGVSPISPIAERRSSKPLVFDQRLNPDLYLHEDSSRVSINTIEDSRDYNRRLNITNPDPVDRD